MMQLVHLWAAFGLVCLFVGIWFVKRASDIHMETMARRAEVAQRNERVQEAFALLQYGAFDEAIEVLNEQDEIHAIQVPGGVIARVLITEDMKRLAEHIRNILD
jgi:hypothetical protein